MESVSTIFLAMEQRIRDKLLVVGATSIDKAVREEEANLDIQEQNWLDYVAGGLFACVKKTKSGRYYTGA